MGALFGPLGGLDELPCASTLADTPGAPLILSRTVSLSGRVAEQLAPSLPVREWELSVGTARPEAAGILYRIASSQVAQARPRIFYSEAAQVENMLDPAGSMMSTRRWTNLIEGGSQTVPHAPAPPRHLESGACQVDGSWAHLSNTPVPHGRTVTVAATLTPYTGMTAYLWVDELRMDGSTIRVHKLTTNDPERRLTATFTTSLETVALTLGVSRAVVVVDPQVTLTDRPIPWSPGAGCLNATLAALPSRQVQAAYMTATDYGRRSTYSWVIREVGDSHMAHTG